MNTGTPDHSYSAFCVVFLNVVNHRQSLRMSLWNSCVWPFIHTHARTLFCFPPEVLPSPEVQCEAKTRLRLLLGVVIWPEVVSHVSSLWSGNMATGLTSNENRGFTYMLSVFLALSFLSTVPNGLVCFIVCCTHVSQNIALLPFRNRINDRTAAIVPVLIVMLPTSHAQSKSIRVRFARTL